MAMIPSLWALVAVAATANPSSVSDGNGDSSNPYAIIVDRNIFRLNPPPPPVAVDQKPVEMPKVYLSGIIKIGDDIRVLFSMPAKDAKGQTSYFKLAPGEMASGERDDKLELVRIHPDQQEVDVVVNGTAMTLSVLSNSLASASAPTGKAGGGAAPPQGVRPGPAAAQPPVATAAAPAGSSAIIVGGNRESTSYGGGVSVGGGGGGVTTVGGNGSSSRYGAVSVGGGGGGVTTIGGNSGSSTFGGGAVSGGSSFGSSAGSTSFGGGVAVGGGAATSNPNNPASQIGALLSGSSGSAFNISAPVTPAEQLLTPDQQALASAANAVKNGTVSLLPPALQAQIDGVPYTPPTPPPHTPQH